jgi:hypothetical protein
VLGVLVALAVQAAWAVAHRLLIENGLGHDRYVGSFAAAIDIATYLMLALATFDVARRIVLARRLGAQIAAWAWLAMVAIVIAGTPLSYLLPRDSSIRDTVLALTDDAWLGLDIVAIVGMAIASGRRGPWLGVIAIGFALLRTHPDAFVGFVPRVGFTALVLGERVLIAIMALDIARVASPSEVDPDRALRALRRLELVAWFYAGFAIVDIALRLTGVALLYRTLPAVAAAVVMGAIALHAAWSLARASIPLMPRWTWIVVAICDATTLARTLSVWFGTFTQWWDRLDETPLKHAHWVVGVPMQVAALVALCSLAIFGRRIASRELARWAAIAIGLDAIMSAASIASDHVAATVISIASNAAAALVYRAAQPAVQRATKLTDVFS